MRWLDAKQQTHWRETVRGMSRLMEVLGQELESETGLTLSEYEVLARLNEAPGYSLRMSVLAEDLVHSRSRLTHAVRRMETAQLVYRRSAAGDGRGVDCVMTEVGRARLEQAAPSHVSSVRRHFVDLVSDEQFDTLGEAFKVIADQIVAERT